MLVWKLWDVGYDATLKIAVHTFLGPFSPTEAGSGVL